MYKEYLKLIIFNLRANCSFRFGITKFERSNSLAKSYVLCMADSILRLLFILNVYIIIHINFTTNISYIIFKFRHEVPLCARL